MINIRTVFKFIQLMMVVANHPVETKTSILKIFYNSENIEQFLDNCLNQCKQSERGREFKPSPEIAVLV